MPSVPLTSALKAAYEKLFNDCHVRAENQAEVESTVARLAANKARYRTVADALGTVPWHFVAVIHCMEASLSFDKHLHNGDPLTARTVQVPRGFPKTGSPPFPWEASARDALTLKKINAWNDWSVGGLLYKLEEYNGWGYRLHHPHVLSPYLWSYSSHYTSGKYVRDGLWDDNAKSKQCGAATLLRRLAEKDLITLGSVAATAGAQIGANAGAAGPILRYSATNDIIAHAAELQTFLNQLPGIFVKVDGRPGQKTSDAFKKAFGIYLPGDPRA